MPETGVSTRKGGFWIVLPWEQVTTSLCTLFPHSPCLKGVAECGIYIYSQKKIKAPVLNPPKSSMFFPPSYVFLRMNHQLLAAITSERPLPLTVTMVGSLCQQHLLPRSMVLPGSPCSSSLLTGLVPCQPPMHPMLTLSSPSGHHAKETSLNATHVRMCTRLSSSTCGSSRLSLTAQFLSYRCYCYIMTCTSYLPWPIPNSGKICKQGQNRVVYNYAKYTVIT